MGCAVWALVEYDAFAFGTCCLYANIIEVHLITITFIYPYDRVVELAYSLFLAGCGWVLTRARQNWQPQQKVRRSLTLTLLLLQHVR